MNNRLKTVLHYVFPTILAQVSFFLFSIVDGIFVGRGIGTDALGAVNIAFPFIMVVGALQMLISIGAVTVIAIRTGRGETEKANRVFMVSFLMTLVLTVAMTFVGTCLTDQICALLGANAVYAPMTAEYIFWYSVFMIPSGLCTLFLAVCRNDGSPILASISVVISTSLNIFGDWLFVYPLRMGLMGAALATGISQTINAAIVLFHFLLRRGSLRFARFRYEKGLIAKILKRGLPECIAQFATPVSMILTNHVLVRISPVAENAYAVIGYVASFAVAVFAGVAEGIQPPIGQCFGAGKKDDMRYFFRAGLLISVVGSGLIVLLSDLFGEPITRLLVEDSTTVAMVVQTLPLYSWGFCLTALNVIFSAYLYSTKRTGYAVILNVLRAFVFNVAAIFLLPVLFGTESIWLTFGVYEAVSAVAAVLLTRLSERRLDAHA